MDSSYHNPNPDISNQLNNSLQFTIHLPNSSSLNTNPVQSPNSDPYVTQNPSSAANSIQDDSTSVPIPKGKRRGRPRYAAWSLNKVQNLSTQSSDNGTGNEGVASSSGQINKAAQMQNSSNLISKKHCSSSNSGSSAKKPVDDMSDEIIVINKDATAEALIALTAGFPADSLTEEEIDYGVVSEVGGIQQVNYILIRNHIITKWRENVSKWVTKEMFVDIVPKHCGSLLDTAYGYLVLHGYINFGVAPAIKERTLVEPRQQNVIVVGAGLAGLAAARQLMAFGFKVTVLEGRRRAGGRVYTTKLASGNRIAAVDLGGTVLTGTLGNPLGILARQLSLTLHKVRDKCPLYRVDGTPVDPYLDQRVESSFNQLLDKLSKVRQSMGEVSQDVSLGAALVTFRETFNEEEMNLFNWHLANLEYANANLISMLSLAFWDQDDPYDMGGDHCFLPGGNGRLVEALAENLTINYGKTVEAIHYGSDGVQVAVGGGQIYKGDMVLCTVPLGVLKSGSIRFTPELPQRKLDAVKRLGFGLLNKVALLFPHAFWGTDLDTFGHLSDHPSHRGEFFLFYSYATVAGGPLLMALVAGEAAHRFENEDPTLSVKKVLRILKDPICSWKYGFCLPYSTPQFYFIYAFNLHPMLLATSTISPRTFFDLVMVIAYSFVTRSLLQKMYFTYLTCELVCLMFSNGNAGIYEPQGIEVPNPLQTCCTRWGSDPLSRGSYSSVAVGASGDDYDILAESVGDGRLFFAGEATNKRYPATMHGALLSGFREAANMSQFARVRALGSTVEKNPSQNAHTCASILADLFRQPDVEFGSFAVLYGRKNANSVAILKVTLGGNRKKPDQQYSNKLLFEQLQSHFNQQQEFHIYTVISKQQALELREVRGGDESRLNHLCEKVGVKLLGRKGLGSSADSVIASIKAERSNRSHSRESSSSGILPSKAASTKQKLVRKAKIVRNSNRFPIPSTNIESKASCIESTTLASSNGSTRPDLDIGETAFSSNKDLPSTTSHNGADIMGDIGCSIPQNLGHNNALTTPCGSNIASSSKDSLALPDSNVGMKLLGDTRDSNPQNLLARSLNPEGSNSMERVLGIMDGLSPSHMDLLGGTNSNVSAALPSTETGTRVVSLVPSNSVGQSFDSQNYAENASDSISCISLQDNIFEDIMNDLLPPSSANCGTWQFTGKL
ncbi:protein flowering locus d [Phtheirospermum japonicum]|uniref:Protein flowering locus d n=1 Tax=Phtheirospermum japonicum TaxID=374723 RepID=A0A830CBE2_9LAMI|nr:protein flowering locus d [Phtheirospermum japonicum]